MKRNKTATVVIAINISGASGRDCLAGIFRFLNEETDWNIRFFDDATRLDTASIAGADGVITEMSVPQPVLKELRRNRTPVVFTDYGDKDMPVGANTQRLKLDDEKIGDAAFRFFSGLGAFASFVFATDFVGKKWSDARERGFRLAAQQNRKDVFSIALASDGSDTRNERAVALKLAKLPKPIAVFSARDKLSVRLLGICKAAKIDVPGKASVLGVDNDELLCRGVTPTLSSILPNHDALGYFAARELSRMLNGGKPKDIITIRDSVREILKRDSTRFVQPAEHIIRNAKDFIFRHASENITPRDVVRHLDISRSLADLRFRELNGVSIRRQIAIARIGKIKQHLISSKNTLSEIAQECGFPNSPSLCRYFKRETGMSPSEWRNR